MNHSQVLELLSEQGLISEDVIEDVAFEATQTGLPVAKVLEKKDLLTAGQFYEAIAQTLGLESVSLEGVELPEELIKLLPVGLAQLHRAIPVGWDGHALQIAMVDPFLHQSIEDLRFALGVEVQLVIAPEDEVTELLRRCYSRGAGEMKEVLHQLELEAAAAQDAQEADSAAAPIVRYVDLVMQQAINDRASDIQGDGESQHCRAASAPGWAHPA
jgi:type IV pilus assembly protein PilB